MSYDEFWNKDYMLVESYTQRHGRELDYHAKLVYDIYGYMLDVMQFKNWCEGDPKKRGKQPKPIEFEPVSDRSKYLKQLQKKKDKEIEEYLSSLRGDKK